MSGVKCTFAKKSSKHGLRSAQPVRASLGDPAPAAYDFTDNEDSTFQIDSQNKSGGVLDTSATADLSISKIPDPALASATLSGRILSVSCAKAGTATLTLTEAAKDGSWTVTLDMTINISMDPKVSKLVATITSIVERP